MNGLERRYPLAARVAAGMRDARLFHGPVRPTWSADGKWFWYATRSRRGIEHVLVDVDARRKAPLFDANALAAALAKAIGHDVMPTALEVARVEATPSRRQVDFDAFGSRWRWIADGRLARVATAARPDQLLAPDGVHALALRGPNLDVLRLADDAVRTLTEDGVEGFGWADFVDYTTHVQRAAGLVSPYRPHALWSPDATRAVVLRVDVRDVPTMTIVESVPSDGSLRAIAHRYPFPMVTDPPSARGRAELWILALDGTRVRVAIDPLETFTHRALLHGQVRWTRDGRHLDVMDHDATTRCVKVWRVDARTGVARLLLTESGPAVVRLAPTIAMTPICHVLGNGDLIGWSQRDGWGHLYLISPDGSARPITSGAWQVRSLLHVDESARRLVFMAGGREADVDPYFDLPYSVAFDGSDLRCLAPDAIAHHASIEAPYIGNGESQGARSTSPDGRAFVDTWSTVASPPRSVLRDSSDGRILIELETGDASDAWPIELPVPEPFRIPGRDGGLDLWGLLYKPAGFDPRNRYPVVEVIYSAPQTTVVPKGWSPGLHGTMAEQLAAIGCVAFIIDGPGTPMRSHAFQLASYGRMESCGGLPEHVAALRDLAATRPWMDLDRVGIGGGSGGGFATVRALADFPDFYRVGVSLCGSHDSTGYIPYWGEMFQGPYDPELYARQDNNRVVHSIRAPLFLIHGELDDNVHIATTLRLVKSLIDADRDFDLLIVPGAGHILFDPYVVRRMLDFFARALSITGPDAG